MYWCVKALWQHAEGLCGGFSVDTVFSFLSPSSIHSVYLFIWQNRTASYFQTSAGEKKQKEQKIRKEKRKPTRLKLWSQISSSEEKYELNDTVNGEQ